MNQETFDPKPGDRAHIRYYTDIQPCTVVKRTATQVEVRIDKADPDPTWKPEMHIGGFAAHCANNHEQRWLITEDPEGRRRRFTLRKNGRWVAPGEPAKGHVTCLGEGWRNFHDYNF